MLPVHKRLRTRGTIAAIVSFLVCAICLAPAVRAQGLFRPAQGTPPYPLYSLSYATGWINSEPLTAKDLKGKVVLVDFWAYSCINCLRAMPYIEAWAKKYKKDGLVVIGVHTPEFGFGQKKANVEQAVQRFGITFPIALDSKHKIWNAFRNQYWPADYFIDAGGKVRYKHFGEGDYDQSERWIQKLLKQRNSKTAPGGMAKVQATGAELPADWSAMRSPETYLGYFRAERFASPGGLHHNSKHVYQAPSHLELNEWALAGTWVDRKKVVVLKSARGRIVFNFHARDLNMVLGPAKDGKPIRFRITVDGKPPGKFHGVDTNADGTGVVNEYRLYQLVRQKGAIKSHSFSIEFEDPGVQAFTFTFG